MCPSTEQLITTGFAKKGLVLLCVLAGFSLATQAQVADNSPEGNGRPLGAVIDEYVREGLQSNLALRAQSLEVERAEAALDGARARYFPEAGFAARYPGTPRRGHVRHHGRGPAGDVGTGRADSGHPRHASGSGGDPPRLKELTQNLT